MTTSPTTTPPTGPRPDGRISLRARIARRDRLRAGATLPSDPAGEPGRPDPGVPDVWLAGLRLGG
ncbi:hypothetical protein [Streptomyces sp. NBC_00198]|uniref:hypothetical protein n=1 Tax=Streptomyces sp. NBC_00198 TaxID=2975677 RepID=UPI002257DC09|nr:hypothetical protein [Streptomyces sp. NBC_00198]MCX5286057.1 hypothetical protein [Streptomyces sp. NBC_00198]